MSEKAKWPRADALKIAQEIQAYLEPSCELGRCVIAGSIRRERSMVGDIEILYVPRFITESDGLFDSKQVDLAEDSIAHLLANKVIEKRPSKIGVFTWGKQNKLAVHVASGIPLDLFCEPDNQDWFRSLVIRTGPKELNIELMATAQKNGVIAHAYGIALNLPNGERVIAASEQEFFQRCGVKYRDLKDR